MNETKERILDTAEELFGENGFSGTSLRSVISRAGVNLAAVHYHFGSKEELLRAVITRRAEPVNAARLAMLEAFEREGSASIEQVLEAFLAPTLRLAREPRGQVFVRLMGRIYSEGDILPRIVVTEFRPLVERFREAFRNALPDLSEEELYWRVHFAIGAMSHVLRGDHILAALSGGLCNYRDVDAVVARMVTFLSAGFRAPATRSEE